MGGYKKHAPTVYIVSWPGKDLIKVGYSEKQRWRKFGLRGAEVLALMEFESFKDAFALESAGLSWLREHCPLAFVSGEEAAEFLGTRGDGWAECYRATPEHAQALLKHMLGHSSEESTYATQRTNATNARLQDIEKFVQLLTARVGLWISEIQSKAVAP